jgi:hypothetical protein
VSVDIGFGLDLSGYSTGRSQLVAAVLTGSDCELVLLKSSPFSIVLKGSDRIGGAADKQADCLRRMLAIGNVAVDVPIDLQRLGEDAAEFAWALTYRPIDKLLGALPPLADRIGSPMARFRHVLAKGRLFDQLGSRLLETYPAASLKRLGCPYRGYKGEKPTCVALRSRIAQTFRVEGCAWNDDELDAAICALTAVSHPNGTIDGDTVLGQFGDEVHRKLGAAVVHAPKGFVLLNQLPDARISLQEADCEDWLRKYASSEVAI